MYADLHPSDDPTVRILCVKFYLATVCNATHGIAVAVLSVRLSVLRRVYCDKTK